MNEIVALAVHDLERKDGDYKIKRDEDTAVTDTTQRVVDELNDLYNRRASKSYGKFTASVRAIHAGADPRLHRPIQRRIFLD